MQKTGAYGLPRLETEAPFEENLELDSLQVPTDQNRSGLQLHAAAAYLIWSPGQSYLHKINAAYY